MKARNLLAMAACWAVILASRLAPAEDFVRYLPEFFIPGETLTVEILCPCVPDITIEEVIPPAWSPVDVESDPSYVYFEESTGRLLFWLRTEGCIPEGFGFSYKVTPPPDYREAAFFEGRVNGWFPIAGDSVIYPREGKPVYRPLWASIQETIDASGWGDTVMVSAGDTVFAEHITMKRGVSLVGYLEPGSSEPPRLRSNSWPLPAITAAPYCKISGFIIAWSACGIRVEDPTVEISNCLIMGTENAAIEYMGAIEGTVTNCTIADNLGPGVLCQEASPDVILSNSIFFGNGGKEFENCTARFCLLEDEIEPGSGENNIFGDPMFVNPGAGVYKLLRGSPCIDAGDNSDVSLDDRDILGKPRILFGGKSGTVDIGAYEYWFISASRQPGSSDLQLRWSSPADGGETTYSVFYSFDLTTWHLADDNVPSAGATTLWTDPIGWPPPIPTRFYRVTANE